MEFFFRWIFPALVGLGLGYWLVRIKEVKQDRIHVLDKKDFSVNMRKGQLIDVRNQKDYDQGRIKGARRFSGGYLKSKTQTKVRRDLPLYLYCNNGQKSRKIARRLSVKGYQEINVLKGGYNAYIENSGTE